MNLKTEGYRISMCGLILVPNNVNNSIFTILSLLWCTTILILSAVEGLNGFKKLNIKDIASNIQTP